MRMHVAIWPALGALLVPGGAPSSFSEGPAHGSVFACSAAPEYYEFPLVTTRRVPGTGRSTGVGQVSFPSSPFGVSIGADGSYVYELAVQGIGLRPPQSGVYVAWVMTPEIDQVTRLGALDEDMRAQGRVGWNKFLVAITLEPADDPDSTSWSGPIVMRGVSRSGLMHTMAGHGPFEQELCAKYGFGG